MNPVELELNSEKRKDLLNYSSQLYFNVPFEVYNSDSQKKLTKLKCNNNTFYDTGVNHYIKFLWLFLHNEKAVLVHFIEVSNSDNLSETDHNILYFLNKDENCEKINKYAFYDKLNELIDTNKRLSSSNVESTDNKEQEKTLVITNHPNNKVNLDLNKKPKYFALDLDGTFLSLNKENLVKNLKIVKKMMDENYVPLVCTGRSFTSFFYDFYDLLEEHTDYRGFPGVYNNGSVVYDKEGVPVHSSFFSKEYLQRLFEYIKSNKLEDGFLFHTIDGYYALADPLRVTNKLFLFYHYFVPKLVDYSELLNQEIVMIYCYNNTCQLHDFVNNVDHVCNITIYSLYSEIIPPNVNKLNGVMKFVQHHNVDLDDIYFIGDGGNDIEIMKKLNGSFCVSNANDDVKDSAKYLLNMSNSEGCVYHLLNRIYFNDKYNL